MSQHYAEVIVWILAASVCVIRSATGGPMGDAHKRIDPPIRAEPATPVESTTAGAKAAGRLTKCQYVSRVDAAPIEYALWYPAGYDPAKPWPLIVFLHGSGEGGDWLAPTMPGAGIPVETIKSDLPFLVVFPLMRGSWSVNGPAELDVLDTIDDVKGRASVDVDRIHLTGLSLGGFAAWKVAAHYPHLFASLSVFAAGGRPELVRNLRHIPVRVFHGTADQHVPIAESRRMAEAMQLAGLPVEFIELRGTRHACWRGQYGGDALYDWMAARRRNATPKRISYTTRSLRHNQAYWVTLDSMTDPGRPASVDVFVPDQSQIFIHLENVARLTVDPPQEVVPAGPTPEFFVNNRPGRAEHSAAGWVVNVDGVSTSTGGLMKRHGLSGPIQDVLYDSFVVVTPASEDPVAGGVWRQAAQFAFRWKKQITFQNFRFITDAEVTPELIESSSLVCFGNCDTHKILQRVADKLPMSFSEKGLVINGRRTSARVAALVMIYPNPLNPDRYIVTCSGRPQDVAQLAALTLQPPYLGSTPIEDLVVLSDDGRLLLEERASPADSQGKWMASEPNPRGMVFDRNWQLPQSASERLVKEPSPSDPPQTSGRP